MSKFKFNWKKTILVSFLLVGLSSETNAELPTTLIKSCYDGDTCTTIDGEKIRLACIDTPELKGKKADPFAAKEARDFLNDYVANWHVHAMSEKLMGLYYGNVKRLIVNAPPRSLKTSTCTSFFIPWLLGKDPSLQIMLVTYSDEFAEQLGSQIRSVMRHTEYKRLFDDTQLVNEKARSTRLRTMKGGKITITSFHATMTGLGADYIIVDDLVNEVGKDATRFIMLSRSNDVQLEFDFEKVKEKSKDNPLYYVQYCYARICSVFKNANEKIENDLTEVEKDYEFNDEEIKIINKISEWPKCVEVSSQKLEPHRIPIYLYQLSALFHSYWNMGKDNESMRFLDKNKKLNKNKAVLLNSVLKTIGTGMKILDVETPETM